MGHRFKLLRGGIIMSTLFLAMGYIVVSICVIIYNVLIKGRDSDWISIYIPLATMGLILCLLMGKVIL